MKILFLFTLLPFFCLSQIQIGNDIVGFGTDDILGTSVSLSLNGNILAIGAPNSLNMNNERTGSVLVYENISNNWIQKGNTIFGIDKFGWFGQSITLSSDGNILAIGVFRAEVDGLKKGLVRVYEYKNNNWIQIGSDINGEADDDFFGVSIDLSSDGTILAVGAAKNHNISEAEGSGYVRVYSYNNSNWNQVGSDFEVESSDDVLGNKISLSSDGTILAIGKVKPEEEIGFTFYIVHALIYKYNGSEWNQIGSIINDIRRELRFYDIDLSSDGTILAIGSTYYSGNNSQRSNTIGQVRTFKYEGNSWNQLGNTIDGNNISGRSVNLSSDGSDLIIGDPYANTVGQTKVYKYIINIQDWVNVGSTLFGDSNSDAFGQSTALSSDGGILAVGAPNYGTNLRERGQVKVYNLSSILSLKELNIEEKIVLYPNPTKESFTIQIENPSDLKKVSLYNNLGQLISTSTKTIVDTSQLASGLYTVEVKTIKGISTKKLIIE